MSNYDFEILNTSFGDRVLIRYRILDLLHGRENEDIKNKILLDKEILFRVDYETFRKILDTGKLFTENNIDDYIAYAFEIQDHQKQILLINYKYQHFDFTEIGENLKL